MKVKKQISNDCATYWILGTDSEIKTYLRNAPIIPAREIVIHTFPSKELWDKYWKHTSTR